MSIPDPTPANIYLARRRAGHNQKEAGKVVGWTNARWNKAETGWKDQATGRSYPLPMELWVYYLYETDQHPDYERVPRKEKLEFYSDTKEPACAGE